MRCPFCQHDDLKVTDSRETENGVRRRRECLKCKQRFTTYERVQMAALMVTKRDGRREEFSREKLIAGVRKACAKRPVSSRAIEKLVEDIEAELQQLGLLEVPTARIGEMVMGRLKQLDRVAYIRYASVYRDFQDIESFEQAVRDLRDDNAQLSLPELAPAPGRRHRRRATRQAVLRRPRAAAPELNGNHVTPMNPLEGDTGHD